MSGGRHAPYVCTSQYDNPRDGYNGNETVLTTSVVGAGLAQPSWSPLQVDQGTLPEGYSSNPVYAQPLYVPGITITGNSNCNPNSPYTCNMVVAVTLAGSIWAWNADTGNVLWSRVGTSGAQGTNYLWADDCGANASVSTALQGGLGSVPFGGIVSTPVIDVNSSPVMYATSLCKPYNALPQWWLHKINAATGADISTIQIVATVAGTNGADDDATGSVAFAAQEVLQRSALLEVLNPYSTPSQMVYVAFGAGTNEAPAVGGG